MTLEKNPTSLHGVSSPLDIFRSGFAPSPSPLSLPSPPPLLRFRVESIKRVQLLVTLI